MARHHQAEPRPFVGRSNELRSLHDLLSDATRGHPAVVLLTGEPGIGKTALLDGAVDSARRSGVMVGRGNGAPLEREFAFGVVRQVFGGLLADMGDAEKEELLGAAGHAAATVLRDRGFSAPPSVRGSFATHHALYRLMGALADRGPLFIAVDDAHLADAPSLRYLSYAVRRIETMPLLFVLSMTEGERPHAEEPLHDLVAAAHRIRPAPLGPDHVAEIVRWSVGDTAAAQLAPACHEVTRGNPFLLGELLHTLHAQNTPSAQITDATVRELGSPTVAARLMARFRSCPDAAALAHAVAILGDRAEFGLAADLADLGLGAAAQALDALVQMKVLQNSYPLTFIHSFVRKAVLENTPVGRRIATHITAAQLLRQAQAPAEQIAAHLLNIGSTPLPWAVDVLRRAAYLAEERGAPDVAATYLQHALRQRPSPAERTRLLTELGSAEVAFAPARGIDRLRTALEDAVDARDAARAALSLVPALCIVCAHEEAVDVADAVLARLGPDDRDLTWALNSMAMVSQFQRMSTVPEARARIDRMSAQVPDSANLRRSRLAFMAAMNSWHGRSREQVVRFTRDALTGADALFFRPPGYYSLFSLACADEPETAKELYAVADRIAKDSGSPRAAAIMAMAHGRLSQAFGDIARAADEFRAALAAFRDCGTAHATDGDALSCVAWLVDVLVPAGRLREAHKALADWGLLADPLPELLHHNFVLCARGSLRIADGDPHGAIDDLEECGRRAEVWQMRNPAVAPWRTRAAMAYTRLGTVDRARELAAEELSYARQWGTARTIGNALHALGRAADGEERATLLTEAVAMLERSPSRLHLACALLDFGVHAHERGRRETGLDALRRAAELARSCGAEPLETQVRGHLAALEPSRGTARRTAPDGLTPQEHRIAVLAAQGATNRQIAEQLCVTIRNVEFHLSGAYRKLRVKRDGLAAALSSGGTPTEQGPQPDSG
ncbi:helix-turn-helix transcriptional regulator [Streptomyces sp. P1-3]|uniref:helix-turn-helix transcriptional regulator n=1 Tax=Streptomyces sp. P1-3 TaxID=3421658 RepID=UPI003D369F11